MLIWAIWIKALLRVSFVSFGAQPLQIVVQSAEFSEGPYYHARFVLWSRWEMRVGGTHVTTLSPCLLGNVHQYVRKLPPEPLFVARSAISSKVAHVALHVISIMESTFCTSQPPDQERTSFSYTSTSSCTYMHTTFTNRKFTVIPSRMNIQYRAGKCGSLCAVTFNMLPASCLQEPLGFPQAFGVP